MGPADLADLPEGFGEGPPGSGLQRFVDQDVSWEACEGGECADIWVPLDYDDPDGLAITLKAKRQTATDDAKRRGSLFINPGGPGESGIEYLGFIGLPDSVRAMYDVVGFDPRGVASSTPIDCLSDSDLDAYIASDPTPDDDQEVQELEDSFATFSEGCLDRSGPLMEHVSTVEVARDLDLMRQLVGDKKLNYFGGSYGTYIGATYAGLFPKKVGRMVLDGAVDPLADPHKVAVHQTAGFQTALDAYLQNCIDKGNCPLGDSVAEGEQRLIDLFKSLDQSPLPTRSGRDLTEGLGFLGVIFPLYSKEIWPYLTQAMQQALLGFRRHPAGAGRLLQPPQGNGTFSGNSAEANPAVNCLDRPQDRLDAADRGQRAGIPEGVERLRSGRHVVRLRMLELAGHLIRDSPTSLLRVRRRSSWWARPVIRRRLTNRRSDSPTSSTRVSCSAATATATVRMAPGTLHRRRHQRVLPHRHATG